MMTVASRAAAAAAVLFVALGLSACAPGPTPTPPPSDSGTPTAEPGDGGTEALACTREDISSSYEATDNTAGQMHGVLSFTNTAPSPCTIDGYPVLYLGSGEVAGPIGLPASYDDTASPVAFTLEPGNVATAAVTITQGGNVEGCNLASTTHFVAAPPLDHDFDWELDGQHVDIPETPICYNDDIGLLMVGPLVLASS
jgi:hypothetical protein